MRVIQANDAGFWLLTKGSNIHLIEQQLPQGDAQSLGFTGLFGAQIGQWQGEPLWLLAEQNDARAYFSLRDQLYLPASQFNLLSRGVEINHFYNTHKFCGKCGERTEPSRHEFALKCTACGYRVYPELAPSIIVAVRRGTQILLANHQRHVSSGLYTVLAGFVEAGETFEQAVAREVWEETSIKIKNLRYFGSQPWAFPNSQMVGYLADYDEGEIVLQKAELQDARWFDCNQPLPTLPPVGTIARQLIETTLKLCASNA